LAVVSDQGAGLFALKAADGFNAPGQVKPQGRQLHATKLKEVAVLFEDSTDTPTTDCLNANAQDFAQLAKRYPLRRPTSFSHVFCQIGGNGTLTRSNNFNQQKSTMQPNISHLHDTTTS